MESNGNVFGDLRMNRRQMLAGLAAGSAASILPVQMEMTRKWIKITPPRIRWQNWPWGDERPFEWACGDCSEKFFQDKILVMTDLYHTLHWKKV